MWRPFRSKFSLRTWRWTRPSRTRRHPEYWLLNRWRAHLESRPRKNLLFLLSTSNLKPRLMKLKIKLQILFRIKTTTIRQINKVFFRSTTASLLFKPTSTSWENITRTTTANAPSSTNLNEINWCSKRSSGSRKLRKLKNKIWCRKYRSEAKVSYQRLKLLSRAHQN